VVKQAMRRVLVQGLLKRAPEVLQNPDQIWRVGQAPLRRSISQRSFARAAQGRQLRVAGPVFGRSSRPAHEQHPQIGAVESGRNRTHWLSKVKQAYHGSGGQK
jgi:hypothetical protein